MRNEYAREYCARATGPSRMLTSRLSPLRAANPASWLWYVPCIDV